MSLTGCKVQLDWLSEKLINFGLSMTLQAKFTQPRYLVNTTQRYAAKFIHVISLNCFLFIPQRFSMPSR